MDGEQRARLIEERFRLERRRNEIARGLRTHEDWTGLRDVCEQIETLKRQLETEEPGIKPTLRDEEEEHPG
jgi:hypothetical protein